MLLRILTGYLPVVHTLDPSMPEAEAGRFCEVRTSLINNKRVPGQTGLQSEILPY